MDQELLGSGDEGDAASVCDIDPDRVRWRGMPAIDRRCTIVVARPTLADSGVWTCQLIRGQDRVEVAPKNYRVSVYSQGTVSFASRPHQKMLAGTVSYPSSNNSNSKSHRLSRRST